ncbi:bb3-type cytochrome oxidase subunit III [Pseudoduganella albidiflava]|uniref:Bb3-type cytochrome oxidase subunit III n=1 Tax=Pseudoduganella albidiflava TaxID=321983 RepID=A0ABX5S1T1_9BURK|nr:bb3-type cytochrome oxidase subunit III [Pseudoduganella albidiflava]
MGLWTFIGVVCTLFALFGAAYLMRIGYEDWRLLPPVPWQLWLSTALLAAGDVAWPLAARAASRRRLRLAHRFGLLGWALSAAFVASQLWAWDAMAAQRVVISAGPAAGFFYMLTGLHIVHVAGGMLAAAWVLARRRPDDGLWLRESLALCARYWHALLLLWCAVFGLLFGLTPELVRDVCAAVGITIR